ncbi:MAG: phosphoribosylanthranilate isomerase [Hyphomicrobiales bacterium]|nr:phosphoribosylanthranilate isomerase [Hyphomicrobiales bacterium]
MSLIVKICGLSDRNMVDAAVVAGADMVGFMFFARSPRAVGLDLAAELVRHLAGRAESVAVMVNMDDDGIRTIVDRVKPDWLQLHGAETPERVSAIRKLVPQKVIKVVGVSVRADLAAADVYAPVADRFLLDAKPPRDADRPGGLGVAFDWTLLENFDPGLPWMLSGGLDPDNVGTALRLTNAPGVDVSSGVETEPGRKDAELIRAFVAAARKADSAIGVRLAS